MYKPLAVVVLCASGVSAEIHTLTLRAAVELAMKQNPDLAMARLEEQKAAQAVRLARDAFIPKVAAGSGLAYSSGFPMSIEGAAPSVVQAQAVSSIFNRPQSYLVAQARENVRGAALDLESRHQDVALRVALLFLDAERMKRTAESMRRQAESLERIAGTVRVRVEEKRELPIAAKRAALHVARARQREQALQSDLALAEGSLAVVLGFTPGDRVSAAVEDRSALPVPPGEEDAVAEAVKDRIEIRRLESALAAKGFELRSHQAARLPKVDLVAQYGLFSRFNNYEDFFRKFQRHNGQVGISLQVPLFTGSAANALVAQAGAEIARLRLELNAVRNRLSLDARGAFQGVKKAETSRDVARLDHEVSREQLSILLAQMEEGRAGLKQVEEARLDENEKWIAYLDAHYALERARLALLRQSGGLMAALR